jgi:hypothetical protein
MSEGALVGPLIESLKKAIPLEVRAKQDVEFYLEGVLVREHLEQCCEILRAVLGPEAKAFGQRAALDARGKQVVEHVGGIRPEQCLFLRAAGEAHMAFAALWPWDSDANRVTLKVGVVAVRG